MSSNLKVKSVITNVETGKEYELNIPLEAILELNIINDDTKANEKYKEKYKEIVILDENLREKPIKVTEEEYKNIKTAILINQVTGNEVIYKRDITKVFFNFDNEDNIINEIEFKDIKEPSIDLIIFLTIELFTIFNSVNNALIKVKASSLLFEMLLYVQTIDEKTSNKFIDYKKFANFIEERAVKTLEYIINGRINLNKKNTKKESKNKSNYKLRTKK